MAGGLRAAGRYDVVMKAAVRSRYGPPGVARIAEVDVPTIRGTLRAKIPPGTRGQRLRLRGQGVRNPRTGQTGDHIYTIRVVVPRAVSPAGLDAATLLDSLYDEPVRKDLPKGL